MGRISVFFCACVLDFIMNDFFLASGRSINIEGIEVHQIKMKDFDQWLQHAEAIKEFVKDRDYSNEIFEGVFFENAVDVIGILKLSTNLDEQTLLSVAGQPRFFELIRATLLINGEYFKPEKQKKVKESGEKTTWFDSFQLLITLGHTHTEIMNMTYGAFNQYLKAAIKARKDKVSYLRFAHHADAKAFSKFVGA